MRIALAIAFASSLALPALCNELDNLTTICVSGEKYCEESLKQFTAQYPKAYKGDYQSQRNVAFCFWDGCYGAVLRNKVQACAWRKIILASGSPRIDDTDVANHKVACGKLAPAELASSVERAKVLMKTIYQRELPFALTE